MKNQKKTNKRVFIRALWGVFDEAHRITRRRFQTDSDIGKLIKSNYNEPFISYTFGKENHDFLLKCGFNSILIHDEPFKWDLVKYQYRHKLEILKYAMEEDGYDEIVHLDWDCFPTRKLIPDFWDTFGKKEIVQANLQKYRASKCYWRKDRATQKYLPNGGYFYIRDKSIPSRLIKIWEGMKKNKQSAEPAMAKLMDEIGGGWQGIEHYWDHFEVETCNLKRKSPYSIADRQNKNSCFIHHAGGKTKSVEKIQGK